MNNASKIGANNAVNIPTNNRRVILLYKTDKLQHNEVENYVSVLS